MSTTRLDWWTGYGLTSAALTAVALSAMICASRAQAAEAAAAATGAGSTTLGELIVTAQKRAENLQNTPVAISAFGANKIQQEDLSTPGALQLHVPSMTYGQNDGFSYITIRGIGSDTTVTAAESSVATYEDGVYTGGLIIEGLPNFDLERIEVLRGPQGTLYGRNTTGGVINYITKAPSFTPGAEAQLSYGNYNGTQDDVAVTGPLIADKLAGRLSFQYSGHGGFRYNLATGQHNDSDEVLSGHAAVLYTPNDKLSVTLRGQLNHQRSSNPYELISQHSLDGVTTQLTPLGIFSLPAAALAQIPGLLSPSDLAKLNGGSIASFYGLLQPGPLAPDPNTTLNFSNAETPFYNVVSDGASATVNWNAGPATVRSITAYQYSSLLFNQDSSGSGTPNVFFYPLAEDSKQFTQEFDVTGTAFNNRLTWLAGFYYLHDDASIGTTVWLPAFGQSVTAGISFAGVPPYPYALNLSQPYLAGIYTAPSILSTVVQSGPDFVPNGGNNLTAFTSIPTTAFLGFYTNQSSQSVAGFGQATFKITDRLRITGGFRYTGDRKSVERSLHSNILNTLGLGSTLCDKLAASKSWSAPTGTVGVEFDAAAHVLTYAKASWGYKAGGFNPAECAGFFNPEYLAAYEGGAKALWADGQILTNLAMYYYDYSDIQFTTYIHNASSIKNAGSATAYGFEFEYALQPRAVRGLQFDGFVSYEHSSYGTGFFQDPAFLIPPPGVNINGNELIRAPMWKANVGGQYSFPLERGSLTIRAEGAYTATIYNDIFNGKAPFESATTQPPYWVANAWMSWVSANKQYEAQLFVNNLTNSLYATNRVGFNTPVTVVSVSGQYAPPRTYGVRLIMKLGSGVR